MTPSTLPLPLEPFYLVVLTQPRLPQLSSTVFPYSTTLLGFSDKLLARLCTFLEKEPGMKPS